MMSSSDTRRPTSSEGPLSVRPRQDRTSGVSKSAGYFQPGEDIRYETADMLVLVVYSVR